MDGGHLGIRATAFIEATLAQVFKMKSARRHVPWRSALSSLQGIKLMGLGAHLLWLCSSTWYCLGMVRQTPFLHVEGWATPSGGLLR